MCLDGAVWHEKRVFYLNLSWVCRDLDCIRGSGIVRLIACTRDMILGYLSSPSVIYHASAGIRRMDGSDGMGRNFERFLLARTVSVAPGQA